MSKKMDRKLKRLRANKAKKDLKKDMKKKVSLFSKMPDNCTACQAEFDRTDKEQVTSWSVVVRRELKKVHLYCPTCWQSAIDVVKDFKQHIENKAGEEVPDGN